MVSPFEMAAQKISELGFFNFVLPFFITGAVFYGLLRRSNLFSTGINVTISLSISLFLWGYLVTTSALEIGTPMAKFFTQITMVILLFLFAIVASSLFIPELNESLKSAFPGGTFIWVMVIIFAIIFFVTSGLGNLTGIPQALHGPAGSIVLIMFFLFIGTLIAVFVGRGG